MSYLTSLSDTDIYLLNFLPLSTLLSLSKTCHSLNLLVSRTSSYISYMDVCNQPHHISKSIYSASHGYLCVLEYLALRSENILTNTNSLLCTASCNGHLEVVKYLVSLGVNIIANNTNTNRLLCYASRHGHLCVIKYLVSLGGDIRACNDYALRSASENGHLETLKYLVSLGGNIRAEDDYALRYASRNGHLSVVKYLISLGANVYACDNYGLRHATYNGNLDVVTYLKSLCE